MGPGVIDCLDAVGLASSRSTSRSLFSRSKEALLDDLIAVPGEVGCPVFAAAADGVAGELVGCFLECGVPGGASSLRTTDVVQCRTWIQDRLAPSCSELSKRDLCCRDKAQADRDAEPHPGP